MTAAGDRSAPAVVAEFGHALRRAGMPVGPARLQQAILALGCVDLARRDDAYWALHCTLVARPEDGPAFDAAFRAYWEGWLALAPIEAAPDGAEDDADTGDGGPAPGAAWGEDRPGSEPATVAIDGGDAGVAPAGDDEPIGLLATRLERLRHVDFAAYGADELRAAQALIPRLAAALPTRRSRRLAPARRGRLDQRRTLRLAMRTGGHPLRRAWRAPREVERRVVFVVDVSRSMEPYTRPVIMFAQAAVAAGSRVEAFSFGTRLTRLTPHLAARDPDEALRRAAAAMPDRAGGTRIGESLDELNRRWGARGLTRGAVVVIVSDGLERGGAALVGSAMARLRRAAHRVVWVNPLAGDPAYRPLAAGMAAALPAVDVLLPGDDLHALERLAGVLAGEAHGRTG